MDIWIYTELYIHCRNHLYMKKRRQECRRKKGRSGPQLAGSRLIGRSLTPGFGKVDRVGLYKAQL